MKVKVWFNAFIPGFVSGVTKHIPSGPFAGQSFLDGPPVPFSAPLGFLTNNRSFSFSDTTASTHFKMHSEFAVEFSGASRNLIDVRHDGGLATQIDPTTFAFIKSDTASTSRMVVLDTSVPVLDPPTRGRISVKMSAAIPLIFGASIVADMDVLGIVMIDSVARTVTFEGLVDSFPAYEAYVSADGGPAIRLFQQDVQPGKTPSDLIGLPNVTPSPASCTF
jgi:hypothetical protein